MIKRILVGLASTTYTPVAIQQSVNDRETACQRANIKYRVVEESGDAFTALIDLARYHDLMVFGLRSVFEYDFLAGNPEPPLIRLVGAGVRPLIAVSDQFRSISRALIAYNGSMESAKAIVSASLLRQWGRSPSNRCRIT